MCVHLSSHQTLWFLGGPAGACSLPEPLHCQFIYTTSCIQDSESNPINCHMLPLAQCYTMWCPWEPWYPAVSFLAAICFNPNVSLSHVMGAGGRRKEPPSLGLQGTSIKSCLWLATSQQFVTVPSTAWQPFCGGAHSYFQNSKNAHRLTKLADPLALLPPSCFWTTKSAPSADEVKTRHWSYASWDVSKERHILVLGIQGLIPGRKSILFLWPSASTILFWAHLSSLQELLALFPILKVGCKKTFLKYGTLLWK